MHVYTYTYVCNGCPPTTFHGRLGAAIKEAERDRRGFEEWKSKGSKEASGSENSQEEMTEIVSSEKTELEVIKSYCEKDVRKIREFDKQ